MKKLLFLMVIVLLAIPWAACTQTVTADVVKSDKPRQMPAVSPADTTALVDGNTTFAFNLYQSLKGTEGNMFYSPYSMSAALAMTYAGARGATAQQMATALQFKLPQDQLHPAFNSLELELGKRGQGAKGKDEKGFRLNVVNAIWGQKDFAFKAEYLDVLAQSYGAGLRVLDFVKAPEPSRGTINQWVSDQTEGKIKNLLPQGSITDVTRLVLTNAIYFNAAWLFPFNDKATASGTFHPLAGGDVTVPMMKNTQSYGYASGGNYQAVELLYDGKELSMVVLLPAEGQFRAFEGALNAAQVKDIISNIKPRQVALTMPKFKFESQFGMKKPLAELGMPVAFTDQADLSGMADRKDLFISDVLHKAFVGVDEAGTEAAAATAVIVGVTSAPPQPVVVTLDRPFLFFIRDIKTGAIIFVGRVVNPA